MDFKIGQCVVKVSMDKWAVIIIPIGSHMIATRIDLYEVPPSNSVNVVIEIYQKDNVKIVETVQRWLRGA